MTIREHLFLKLMEECAEIQQITSKLLQFGPDNIRDGEELNNTERLRLELNDLLAVVWLLEVKGHVLSQTESYLDSHITAKEKKIEKYLRRSIELGTVTL